MSYTSYFLAGLKPDPRYTVSEWADAHRKLSQRASAEPGRWRTDRTPYLREIMDCLGATSPIKQVSFMKGAQIGATECGNNWIGYVIDSCPGPMFAVQPTVETAKRNSKQRIAPLIEESPRLKLKVKDSRSRDSGNTMLSKEFPGGVLIITGANSAVGLRSMPARFIFGDEVDAWPSDVDGEGDPVDLALARTRTFANKKVFFVSTPTFEGRSRIQTLFESSDKRFYHVPCPHCGHFQVLKWDRIRWLNEDPKTAHLVCIACDQEIYEASKTEMLSRGKWIATDPGPGKDAGFHLSSLYSPVGWLSWADIVKDWLEIKKVKSQDRLRVFVNTVLGETWKEKGDAPDYEKLYGRRESYPIGQPPSEVVFLTAGVDVQKDRLEVLIEGWGESRERWAIDHQVLMGDTTQPQTWQKLSDVLNTQFISADNRALSIQIMCVDSGYNTQWVYDWCRRWPPSRVIAIKGSPTASMMIGQPSTVDLNLRGKRIRRGFKVWPVGVNLIKGELYNALKLSPPEGGGPFPAGFAHFPEFDHEFFKQLTAEVLVKKVVKGFTKFDWEKTRERNEILDLYVYNRAAAAYFGIDRFSHEKWAALRGTTAPVPAEHRKAKKKGKIKRRPSTWL